MAQRRMFSKKITDTDLFLDMPLSAQCLYFHLNMEADDDGFIGNAKTIRRKVGASEDDMKVLITKQFILPFDTGVVVIKDWRIHNYIQKDRYHKTVYTDEKALLEVRENGEYTTCVQDGYKMDTEVRLELELGKSKSKSNMQLQGQDESVKHALEFYQNNFGILSPHIQEDLMYWCQDCPLDLVLEAMKRALTNQKPYSYAQGILKSWLSKNIRTLEQAQAEAIQHKQQQQRNGNHQPVYHVEDYRKELYGE